MGKYVDLVEETNKSFEDIDKLDYMLVYDGRFNVYRYQTWEGSNWSKEKTAKTEKQAKQEILNKLKK
jgi:hypothetical protein